MKFTKSNGTYIATRKDGQVITIELSGYNEGKQFTWVSRYEGDDNGDNTLFAATKRELVSAENDLESRI